MTTYYFDTSAIMKRYVPEPGTTALLAHEQYLAAGLPVLTFVSADADLLVAARAEGLSAENPNDHP